MKYLYVGLLTLALLLGACWWSAGQISARTQAAAAPLELAAQALEAGDGTLAASRVARAEALWRQGEELLAGLTSHAYTSQIRQGLREAGFLEGRELERALALLLEQLQTLAELERPVWRNIF